MTYDLLAFAERGQPVSVRTDAAGAPRHRDRRARRRARRDDRARSSTPTGSGGCCRPARRPRTRCSATRSSAAALSRPTSPPRSATPPAGPATGRRRTTSRQRLAGLRQQGPGGREVRAILRDRAMTSPPPIEAELRPQGDRSSTTRAASRPHREPGRLRAADGLRRPERPRRPRRLAPTPWETYTYDANDNAGPHPRRRRRGVPRATGTPRPASRSTRSAAPSSRSPATDPTPTPTGSSPARLRHPGQPARRSPTRSAGWRSATATTCQRRWRVDSIDAGRRDTVLDAARHRRREPRQQGRAHPRRLRRAAPADPALGARRRPPGRSRCGSASTTATPATPPARRRPGRRRRRTTCSAARRHYDEAGLLTVADVDFKGNVLDTDPPGHRRRPILAVYGRPPPRWQVTPFQVDWNPRRGQTAGPSATPSCSTRPATARRPRYDALNRVTRARAPGGRRGAPRECCARATTAPARWSRSGSTTPSTSSASPTTPRASAR